MGNAVLWLQAFPMKRNPNFLCIALRHESYQIKSNVIASSKILNCLIFFLHISSVTVLHASINHHSFFFYLHSQSHWSLIKLKWKLRMTRAGNILQLLIKSAIVVVTIQKTMHCSFDIVSMCLSEYPMQTCLHPWEVISIARNYFQYFASKSYSWHKTKPKS